MAAAFFFGSSKFASNLPRLMGLHGLTAAETSKLAGISPQAVSEWRAGKRQPSLEGIMKISTFFEVSADRLVQAPFPDLLTHELADPARYERVEAKITSGLKASPRKPAASPATTKRRRSTDSG